MKPNETLDDLFARLDLIDNVCKIEFPDFVEIIPTTAHVLQRDALDGGWKSITHMLNGVMTPEHVLRHYTYVQLEDKHVTLQTGMMRWKMVNLFTIINGEPIIVREQIAYIGNDGRLFTYFENFC